MFILDLTNNSLPLIQNFDTMDFEYLDNFEEKMQEELLRLCRNYKMLDNMLLCNDDIDERWKELAPEYMVDAVEQIRDYPTVSVAWAAYIGMAIAWSWDADWERHKDMSYKSLYGPHGFDDMDEHIVGTMLGVSLDSAEAKEIEAIIRRCGETAVTLIRHEQIDPQTPMAFHVFARACRSMYRIGAAIELKRLGYHFEKINLN